MKKTLFLITTCLLLTGCTINYDLEITENNFKETISGTVLNSEIEKDDDGTDTGPYLYFLNSEQTVFHNNENIFYKKTKNNTDKGIDFEYSYTFNENNFVNSRILNECFDEYNFEKKENKYYISINGKFKCNYTKTTNINIKTNYKVTAHNAKENKKGVYSWTIDENNMNDLQLFISIDKTKNANSNQLNWSSFKTIGLIILLILSGVAIFLGKTKLKD